MLKAQGCPARGWRWPAGRSAGRPRCAPSSGRTQRPAARRRRSSGPACGAKGLGRRGGRRSMVVRCVRKLLAQLQVVQDQPFAVVGNAQTVCGLAIGVGADPGGQPGARVGTFRQESPVQRAQRGVQADFVDGQPGVALQVQRLSQVDLKVAVRAGHPLAAVHVDRRHPWLRRRCSRRCSHTSR